MTISSTDRVAGPFIGNDTADDFPFEFKVFTAADVLVVQLDEDTEVESTLVLNTDYTVALNSDQNANPGGTVTLPAVLAAGQTITITSSIAALQPTDLTNQGGFYPSVITNALDRVTILVQQIYSALSRTPTLPLSTPSGVSTELPLPSANKLIGWNADADGFENYDSSTLATLVAYGTANADLFDGDGTTTVFALSANPAVLNNLDVSISGVTQTPGVDYTWTSGTNITFTTAPPSGTDNILVRYMQGLPAPDTAIRAELVAGGGANLVGFSHDETYGTGTVGAKLGDVVSVKDQPFGAVGDGTTDDTAAIQAAINAVQGTSVALFFPPGTYKVTASLMVTGALAAYGVSRYGTAITWTNTSLVVFDIQSDAQVEFENLTFSGPLAAVGGSAISLAGGATQNLFSVFRDCTFAQGYTHIFASKAADWTVDNCYFTEYVQHGTYVGNTYSLDAGDSAISNSTFSSTQTNAEAIHQASSGGLKVSNNKLIGGAYGYRLVWDTAGAASTSILAMSNNSIENQTVAGVSFSKTGAGAQTFAIVQLTGNHFANQPSPISFADTSTTWLSKIAIVGGTITLPVAGGTCITLAACAQRFIVDGVQLNGSGGTTFGIAIGSGAVGRIGDIEFNSIATQISNGSTKVIGSSPAMLANSATQITAPLDTVENVLATITIPAGSMGKNGSWRLMAAHAMSGVGNKTFRVRWGGLAGTAIYENTATSSAALSYVAQLHNRNAVNSQVGGASVATASGFGVTSSALPTAALDTNSDQTVVITIQKATGADSVTLECFTMELVPGIT